MVIHLELCKRLTFDHTTKWDMHKPESVLENETLEFCDTNGSLRQKSLCHLVRVYRWSGFCKGTAEELSLRFFTMLHVKDQVLGNVFGGIFSDSFRQNLSPHSHCQDIIAVNFQDPARSGIFCLLVVYWPCDWKYLPKDKFGFSRDNW